MPLHGTEGGQDQESDTETVPQVTMEGYAAVLVE